MQKTPDQWPYLCNTLYNVSVIQFDGPCQAKGRVSTQIYIFCVLNFPSKKVFYKSYTN